MNKAQLVEALTTRIGDRRTAAAAVDGIVDVIVETVGAGRSVTLTGFGVFEPRRRAARVARNPRTGETVPVPETIVPSFRPGAAFREQIGSSDEAAAGATSAPRRAPRTGSGRSAAAAAAPSANGAKRPAPSRSRSTRAAGTSRTAKSGTAGTSKATAAENGTPAAAAKATPARKTTATKKTGTTTPAKRAGRSKAADT